MYSWRGFSKKESESWAKKLTPSRVPKSLLNSMDPVPKTLIRASVQGIVYLIESATGKVYTYNPESPTYIGLLEKIPEAEKHLISKTNGCLANARVKYRDDIKEVMASLRV
jgi:hypothetical protein